MVNGEPLTRSCRVFLSFSRESSEHVERVSQLYELLRDSGVDAQADFVAAEERQDWGRWIQQQMSMADRVLVIVSPEYKRRFEGKAAPGTGRGVQHEARFIREHLYKDEETGMRKFLPVLLPGATVADIPDVFQPTSATNYVVSSLTHGGVRRLVRLLTGQPARVEQPLKPIIALPLEQNASSVVLHLLVGTSSRSGDDELAWQLASSACLLAGVSAVNLGLVASPASPGAVVPMVSGRDVLGRWVRALHQQVKAVNGNHRQPRLQARLGLHRRAPEADEEVDVNLAAALADCETARIMLGAHAADLIVVTSDEFHELVADHVVHFPAASAYRPFTMNRVNGRHCWVAVAGHSVCPELPPSAPSAAGPTAREPDASGNGSFSLRDNSGLAVQQGNGSSFHLGDVYGRRERGR